MDLKPISLLWMEVNRRPFENIKHLNYITTSIPDIYNVQIALASKKSHWKAKYVSAAKLLVFVFIEKDNSFFDHPKIAIFKQPKLI